MSNLYENIIIIPYRNREKHLSYFIENTVPLIEEFMPKTLVLVIEQEEGKMFNRGAVLNVAFKIYENKVKYFITHDVDINPTKNSLLNYYNKEIKPNTVLGILVSIFNTLAPIIKIHNKDIIKINGFPNNFWGWGAEDHALRIRAEYFNLKINKIFLNKTKIRDDKYFKCFNDIDDRQKKNHSKNLIRCRNFNKLSKKKKKNS